MKKIVKFLSTAVCLAFLFLVAACNFGIDIQEKTEVQETVETTGGTGSASFSIVVPDYYAMAGLSRGEAARAIAPQTAKVKLSYKRSEEWVTHTIMLLSEAEKTAIPNAPAGFAGSAYKCSFASVPSGVYSRGEMKIDLLDSVNNIISSGTNDSAVNIISNESTQATFYTIPTSSASDAGTLAAGEMKFLKKQFDSASVCTLTISAASGNTYPDVVIFNENGTFEKYIAVSAGNKNIDCEEYKGTIKYLGFWSAAATSYTTEFSYISKINQTFESALDTNMWIGAGLEAAVLDKDSVYAGWDQYGDALIDTHGKVYKLGTYDGSSRGTSSLTIYKITVAEESALSFDYKCDLWNSNLFNVYIDDASEPSFQTTGYRQMWQKGSVILSSGTHSVKFTAETPDGYIGTSLSNATYIDNITLAANTTDSVDIQPKGLQETYIGGDSIQFSAKALRSDGSVISGKSVTWSASGGSITSSGLFTPGSSSGTYTVTATIDGKTASNQTVKVHGADYKSDSVIIAGHEYTGTVSNVSGTFNNLTESITFTSPTPGGSSFEADGFFVISGTVHRNDEYENYALIKVEKGDYSTSYFVKDTFTEKIWLRFGAGVYTVSVHDAWVEIRNPEDSHYEGAIKAWTYYGASVFTVTNTAADGYSAEQCAYLMPSYICQSDDFIVSNAFNAVIAELPENAAVGQKLQALHDWETQHHQYDHTSADDSSKRKRQDAVHVVKYGMGVCEGYANLYAALVRMLGVQTAYQSSSEMNHAWVECKYNGGWKLVDVTWDDHDRPAEETYKYFLIALEGVNGDHYNNKTDYGRSALPVLKIPHVKDMPDGWY